MHIKRSDLRRIIREELIRESCAEVEAGNEPCETCSSGDPCPCGSDDLEMHLAPEGLDDMGPEEAYGLGYDAGKDFVIQRSDIQGMGAFIDRDFRQGEEVGVCHVRKPESGWDVTELGRYHNHSEEPSCANVMDGNVRRLHALRDLPVGTEITVDYREQPDLEQPEESWCT